MTLSWRSSGRVRAKIEKCHDAIEDGASFKTSRVYIEAKSRHMQSLRERGDTSVENKLEEG